MSQDLAFLISSQVLAIPGGVLRLWIGYTVGVGMLRMVSVLFFHAVSLSPGLTIPQQHFVLLCTFPEPNLYLFCNIYIYFVIFISVL